jgi:ATP-binding cassette subfamily C (CFTR/MRP) protein 1
MTSPSTLCEIAFDDTFGPGVQGCRDNFDFTLLFEQSVMSIGPSILFLLFFSIRIWQLYRQDAKVLSSLLSWMKLV